MNKKLIVTHIFPDLDAIASVWLLMRFDPQWQKAELKFVPAGDTYQKQVVDSDPDVVHVDTGSGRFDHHQDNQRTCAAELVFNYLKNEKKSALKYQSAVKRLIEVVIQVDQFEDFYWPDPANDRYEFFLPYLLNYLKLSGELNDKELIYQGIVLLDALFFGLRQKIKLEEEISQGQEFTSKWGRSLAVESQIGGLFKLAHKLGFALVVEKEPQTGMAAIKCQPKKEFDLTVIYERLKSVDSQADWYFHQSKHIISNGSRHNPKMRPTKLSLSELMAIVRRCG